MPKQKFVYHMVCVYIWQPVSSLAPCSQQEKKIFLAHMKCKLTGALLIWCFRGTGASASFKPKITLGKNFYLQYCPPHRVLKTFKVLQKKMITSAILTLYCIFFWFDILELCSQAVDGWGARECVCSGRLRQLPGKCLIYKSSFNWVLF